MVKYVSKDIICAKMMKFNFRSPDMTVSDFINDELPAADVQPVIETEDLATATEQFICKNCGIRIENFDKVVLEEDNDGYINKLFYEYRFKFCSECGAKVKED